ncbi:hypothetical protein [Mesorhizobium sp. KR1-2]|uniref:hypothetical protein n=1 Tax=Mesorhizobium sp. KR1-2 TaxID=3156609 RepID=UPI0032B3FA9B
MNKFYKKANKLQEIRLQILDLIYEAQDAIDGTEIEELAARTWLEQIRAALYSDPAFATRLIHTMEDSEAALFEEADCNRRAEYYDRAI